MKRNLYSYIALNDERREIRLLTLLPGPAKSPPRIRVHVASIDDKPKFEALSYTWGDPGVTHTAIVQPSQVDKAEDGTLPITIGITTNLAEALEHLRLPDEERVLWVDGICINQQDLSERTKQVKLMGDIYKIAHRVLVWLGPLDDDTSHALDLYDTISRNVIVDWISGSKFISYVDDVTDAEKEFLHSASLSPTQTRCMYALWRRPWFGRVWIRQEVLLGEGRVAVFCGRRGIPWKAFITAHFFIFLKGFRAWDEGKGGVMNRTTNQMKEVERLRKIVKELCVHQPWNLPSALRVASKCGCLNPRDKLYGSYGVFPPAARHAILEGIPVNYENSVLDVYRKSALYVVEKCGRLDFLRDCGGSGHIAGRPSWIPHWDTPIEKERLNTQFSMFSRTDAIWTGPETDRLRLSAVLGPKILEGYIVEPPVDTSHTQLTQLAEIFQWTFMKLIEMGDEDPFDAITNVFMHGRSSRYVDGVRYNANSYDEARRCVVDLIRTQRNILLNTTWQHFGADWRYLITVASRSCEQHRIIITENGLLGLAPRLSLDGDIIAIMPGYELPILLRQQDNGAFIVIGECYVHGLSFGEGLVGPLDPTLRVHLKQIESADGQKWEFAACRRLGGGFTMFPDPRLNWEELKVKDEDAEFYFRIYDQEANESKVYANRPNVDYFRAAGVPLQVIELA